jgi:hypothetical protein
MATITIDIDPELLQSIQLEAARRQITVDELAEERLAAALGLMPPKRTEKPAAHPQI